MEWLLGALKVPALTHRSQAIFSICGSDRFGGRAPSHSDMVSTTPGVLLSSKRSSCHPFPEFNTGRDFFGGIVVTFKDSVTEPG